MGCREKCIHNCCKRNIWNPDSLNIFLNANMTFTICCQELCLTLTGAVVRMNLDQLKNHKIIIIIIFLNESTQAARVISFVCDIL